MSKRAGHNANCQDAAIAAVQEELDLQGVAYDTNAAQTDLEIPAWGTTVYALAAEWLADGNVACSCN